jgi:hypothetical protein
MNQLELAQGIWKSALKLPDLETRPPPLLARYSRISELFLGFIPLPHLSHLPQIPE